MALVSIQWGPSGLPVCIITLQYDNTQSNPTHTVLSVTGSTSPYPNPVIGANLEGSAFLTAYLAAQPVAPPPILNNPVTLVQFDVTNVSTGTTNFQLLPSTLLSGLYRISGFMKITQAATTSSKLGVVTISYAADDGVVVTQTLGFLNSAGGIVTSNSANSTTSTGVMGLLPISFFAQTGTALT